MHQFIASALLAAAFLLGTACGDITGERSTAVLLDGNLDKIPESADTNGDGKADLALGNRCQLVCDGTELTGIDVDCDGAIDFDIRPVELPEVCGDGGGGNGGGGGSGTLEECASTLNEQSVACTRENGGPWSCACTGAGASRTVSYTGDDACSIPGGACF